MSDVAGWTLRGQHSGWRGMAGGWMDAQVAPRMVARAGGRPPTLSHDTSTKLMLSENADAVVKSTHPPISPAKPADIECG